MVQSVPLAQGCKTGQTAGPAHREWNDARPLNTSWAEPSETAAGLISIHYHSLFGKSKI